MPNDHVGSCVDLMEVTPGGHHYILTVSRKAVLINMEGKVHHGSIQSNLRATYGQPRVDLSAIYREPRGDLRATYG